MFLVNTNVWLWSLLYDLPEPERSKFRPPANKTTEEVWQETTEFLMEAWEHLFITDFGFYSLGIFLFRVGRHDLFVKLTEQLKGKMVRLGSDDFGRIAKVAQQFFGLDFDDAYQYVAAEKHNLVIVSFDSDFDRTERGRLTPDQALERIRRRR